MNYQHHYHAGNPADVFKHTVLILLLEALRAKDKPFCYLDTHTGMAGYDLTAKKAQATGEYLQGIAKIWQPVAKVSIPFQAYLNCITQFNTGPDLHYYPGSALIAKQLLRPDDRMILCELEADPYQDLKQNFYGDKQVGVHQQDGYQALKAFLPPKERRGLVLIDPPYEEADEWQRLPRVIHEAWQRWPTGMYALWYPIKDPHTVQILHNRLARLGIPKILACDLCPWPGDMPQRLNGSGMVIINPPWQFDKSLKGVLPLLLERLRQHPLGSWRVKTLS